MSKDVDAGGTRRVELTNMVLARGFVRVDELAEYFDVSPMTIYRDIARLHDRGVVKKVRTGVRAIPVEERERNVSFRAQHMRSAKLAIANAAMDYVNKHALKTIALDDSTTALALIDKLIARPSTTLVTNFAPAIERIARSATARLLAVGGEYSSEYRSFQGSHALEMLNALQVDATIISSTAVGTYATFHPSEQPLQVKRAMLNIAANKMLLIDHTKFSRRALHKQADLSEFDVVIVDDQVDHEDLANLQNHVPTVIVASSTQGRDPTLEGKFVQSEHEVAEETMVARGL